MIKRQELRALYQSSRVRRYFCLLIAGIVVFNLFFIGSKPVAVGLFLAPWDKVAHYAVFSCITALLWYGFNGRRPALIVLLVIAIGALDEIHQTTLPGRQADILDFATDITAALCAGCLLYWMERRRPQRRAA